MKTTTPSFFERLIFAVIIYFFTTNGNAQITTNEIVVEQSPNTQIDDNTVINGELSVSATLKANTITANSVGGKPNFYYGLLSNTVASFEIDYVSGTIDVGTMQRGDVWLVTAALKSYGSSDNRGGSWIVAYSGTVMVINQLFKLGHTVSLYHGGNGIVRYSGGGGLPRTTVAVLKLTD